VNIEQHLQLTALTRSVSPGFGASFTVTSRGYVCWSVSDPVFMFAAATAVA
jgi:hypothetical protein